MSSLQQGTRVALDTTTKMIMHSLPPKVDPSVSAMMEESTEQIKWSDIGGLNDQIREIREVSRMPLISIFFLGHRASFGSSGILRSNGYQGSQGRSSLRSSWNRENVDCEGISIVY